jgi:hypothetical protein
MGREIHSHKSPGLNGMLYINVMDEPDHETGGGACHEYRIGYVDVEELEEKGQAEETYLKIEFQHGPVKEHGVNGITEESLLAVVRDRLLHFQIGKFACQHNKVALEYVDAALNTLHQRTATCQREGVEGKNKGHTECLLGTVLRSSEDRPDVNIHIHQHED